MNILALNSSPRDHETSKTELVLQKFLEGAKRAGAVAETLYLRNYKINHCLGCYDCWLKTPGRSSAKGRHVRSPVRSGILAADLVVLASPSLPCHYECPNEAVRGAHPAYDGPLGGDGRSGGSPHRFEKMPRVVTLSVAGYWDQVMFQALSMTWRMCLGGDLIAEIYRHSSEFLAMPEFRPQVQAVLDAIAQAGEKVVRQGRSTQPPWPRSPRPGPGRHPGAPVPGILVQGAAG